MSDRNVIRGKAPGSRSRRFAPSAGRHERNETRRAGLDAYAAHPAVERVYEDAEGIWADLRDGWEGEDGVITVHGCPDERGGNAYRDFVEQFKHVRRRGS